jgi:hypothetical protein
MIRNRPADCEENTMNDNQIHVQYSTDLSRRDIEQALVAAGKDINHLQPADLGPLGDFHTMGRIATSQLVDLIDLQLRTKSSTRAAGSAAPPASSPRSTDAGLAPSI